MRAILITLLLAAATPARAADPVRLAVLLVVDQMRWDYPERAPEHGFGRFLREGTYYANARHAHVPTYTGVGHASLATGSYPSEHGILGNDFYDPAAKKTLYCVEDESGAKGPFRLKVATLGDRLKEANAGAKVVSISGKDRAAILMGGRKADLALWYDKKSGRFVTSGYYGKPPSWVEAFNDENEVPEARRSSIRQTPHFDMLTLALAKRALEAMDLGEDDAPDLLLVSLSATDYLGHALGPFDPKMDDNLTRIDRELGSFLDFLDFKVGAAFYAAGLSSDHGVLPVPESEQGRAMGARRVSQKQLRSYLEEGLRAGFGRPVGGGDWILGWNPPVLYLDAEAAAKAGGLSALERKAAELIGAREDVVWAHPARAIPKSAAFAAVYERSLPVSRDGVVAFLNKEGVLLTDYPEGTSHGTPYDYDARVPVALLGPGVAAGRRKREAFTAELAPALGRLLGLRFEGAFLEEAFKK